MVDPRVVEKPREDDTYLKSCRLGSSPVKLCVEKTKNVDQFQPPRTCRHKWTKILIIPFPQI